MVTCWGFPLVCCHLSKPFLQFLFQSRGHEDGAAGGRGFGAFQDEGSGAAFQLIREHLDDAAIVHLIQGFFSHPLHVFKAEDFQKAFDTLADRNSGAGKVVLTFA